MPPPRMERKRAAADLSQADRAGPAKLSSISQYAPSSRPTTHTPPADQMYTTDVRQTDIRQLNAPWGGA